MLGESPSLDTHAHAHTHTFYHAQARSEDGHQRDGLGRHLARRIGESQRRLVLTFPPQPVPVRWAERRREGREAVQQWGDLTSGPAVAWTVAARASAARMSEMSWISDLTSRGLVWLDRSLLSLARRQGCEETCTLGGSGGVDMLGKAGRRARQAGRRGALLSR
ncbi:hypothetical protein VTK73DRAFT_6517 [Phialemonium thermophilum]|uniref:Uncharacterized protein n=1 Tax=Phialemonium thermophilum TaxID=223376 RepID=A0ABR3V0I3_9PEZI